MPAIQTWIASNRIAAIAIAAVSGLLVLCCACGVIGAIGNHPKAATTTAPTHTPAATHTPTPIHYPPATLADLQGLAKLGNAGAVHEFHSETVGLAGVCPIPRREVTVDQGVTGQQLAADLLAYYTAQQLENPCGALVLAWHSESEAGDAYTAGRINLDVTDTSGAANLDPNGQHLTYKLTLDIGSALAPQESIVTYQR